MGMKVNSNRLWIGKWGKGPLEGLCEYKRKILKWILRNCISLDFDYSWFRRALSVILIDFVINRTFHKIVWNILISWATIGIAGNTVYWMCLVLWSVVYCFSVMCIFFQLDTAFKLVPEIVQCCPPQSEVMWRSASDAVCSVTSVHTLGPSLCQWLLLLLSMTFTVNCQRKCLVWLILLLYCSFLTVNII